MSEQTMRSRVVRILRPLHAIAVENLVLPGTPDVNYAEGWIELKWLRSWPVRSETVVRFEHFTVQQRIWHLQRRQIGGKSWLLVQCKREWLLFDGAIAALNFEVTKAEMLRLSERYWGRGLEEEEFIQWISQKPNDFCWTDDVAEKLKSLLRNAMESPSIVT